LKQWVTFQLSDRGESLLEDDPEVLEQIILKHITSEYFIPMYYNKSKSYDNRIFLIRGYFFIEFNSNEVKNYAKLAESYYFVGPLLVNRRIHLTPHDEIKRLKSKLAKMTKPTVKVGDTVKIIDGKYQNLEAVVTEFYPKEKEADLSVKLKCMSILVPRIPVVCLKNISTETKLKNTLQEKVLQILKEHVTGLTRKNIIDLMDLTEQEIKRVSTCLSRAVKRGYVSTQVDDDSGASLFIYCKQET